MLGALSYLSLLGVLGLAATVLLGFEEPPHLTLVVSGILSLAAPLGILGHIVLTRELTSAQKLAWVRALLGAKCVRYWRAYSNRRRREAATRVLELQVSRADQ